MLYELEAYNTEACHDIRYRDYTTSRRKAEAFAKIPRIQFTDSGHGIVFTTHQVAGRKPTITCKMVENYVRQHLQNKQYKQHLQCKQCKP